jgi:hypothetical protein
LAYPNPTSSTIFFDQLTSLSAFDLSGKPIETFTNVRSINASGWPAGVYILQSNDGSRMRVIKN